MERLTILVEITRMVVRQQRWVLLPAFFVLILVSALVFAVQASPLAPFIYPLF